MQKNDFLSAILNEPRTVFSFSDIALLLETDSFNNLKRRINYFVKKGTLINPRRGLYAKKNYSPEELASKIYKPSYISLEYVLRKSGIIFQYGEDLTIVSYLTRNISIEKNRISVRKIKNTILVNTAGIQRDSKGINVAVPERAFLDTLYLNREYYFDNLNPLKRENVAKLLPVYNSAALEKRVKKILEV